MIRKALTVDIDWKCSGCTIHLHPVQADGRECIQVCCAGEGLQMTLILYPLAVELHACHAGDALSGQFGCTEGLGPCAGLCALHVAHAAAAEACRLRHRHRHQHQCQVGLRWEHRGTSVSLPAARRARRLAGSCAQPTLAALHTCMLLGWPPDSFS